MEEHQWKECKICLEVKERIFADKYPDGKNNRWVSPEGKQWNGRVCPTCVVKKSREHMRTRRLKGTDGTIENLHKRK